MQSIHLSIRKEKSTRLKPPLTPIRPAQTPSKDMSADASSAIIRTNATKKAPRNKPQGDRALTVYNAEMTHCYTVPQDRVAFVPSPISKDRQLSLCPEYTESATCPRGESCTGVHANVDGLEKLAIHINFAWKDAESVSYARLTPGETLSILAPNNRPPMEQLASELILVTKGSLSHQQDPSSVPPPRPFPTAPTITSIVCATEVSSAPSSTLSTLTPLPYMVSWQWPLKLSTAAQSPRHQRRLLAPMMPSRLAAH